ncbi:MAG: PQQ-binding-like beta-propeller repeat protein [bacterium]|nr:PQQ-binding-like beta-propeller repeat protein [bacterium]
MVLSQRQGTIRIRHWRGWAILLSFLLLGTSACGALGGSTGSNDWTLVGVTPDERHLLVTTMYGGVASGCTRWEGWEVEETDDRVEVNALLWRKRFPGGCTVEGVFQSTEINLSAPLGDRELVGCGRSDCRTYDVKFPGWQGDADIALFDDGVVLAGASATYSVSADGPIRWDRSERLYGLVVVAGDRLVAFDGSATFGLDVSSGAQLWRFAGQPLATDDYAAYVCRGDILTAVDIVTGAEQWTAAVPCGFMVPTGDIATMVGGDRDVDGGYELVRIDLPGGDVIERRPFNDGVDDQVTGFDGALAVGDRILVAGTQAELVVLGMHGDELVRQPNGIGRPIGSAAGLAILVSHARVVAVDPINGEVMWSSPDYTRGSVAVSGGALWTLDADAGTVSRFDAESGTPMWTAPVGTTSGFAVVADESTVFVATSLAVVALDASTGDLLWWHHIPSEQP